ncbi:MAG: M20/M25/M40 family metallo-hydrolase, partial [Planctomycetota bacterium]
LDAAALERMHAEARAAAARFAAEGGVEVSWERLWSIAPAPFHPELIGFADEAVRETCGTSHRLPSGPLHDAAEMAMAGVPTVMLFVQSLKGISHNKIEDTRPEHLELAVRALDRLAERTMRWVAAGGGSP